MDVTLYHNPRCSKSRATLALLEAQGITPKLRLYLDDKPNASEIKQLLNMLGMRDARSLMRTGEEEYTQGQLANSSLSQAQLIEAMVNQPKLIERPIAIHQGQARIGRPPESVLEII
jgi:arsenate reductase